MFPPLLPLFLGGLAPYPPYPTCGYGADGEDTAGNVRYKPVEVGTHHTSMVGDTRLVVGTHCAAAAGVRTDKQPPLCQQPAFPTEGMRGQGHH